MEILQLLTHELTLVASPRCAVKIYTELFTLWLSAPRRLLLSPHEDGSHFDLVALAGVSLFCSALC
jgi:hypothetical protein